ncbi:TRAP transporter large permease, partial [Desulfovibrio sp. OttesenSCG-928-I05]|nr:TRAP transporter large permease [Desulfovibrio sp. OttesenSCG-928-I05]
DDILEFSNALVGCISGGLGAVVIVACMVFAALSGSGLACTAAIGAITINGMARAGYKREFAGAITAGGGALGVMIPPSNPMIIYGVIAGVSIGKLFLAGVTPGLLLGASMIAYIWIVGRFKGLAAANTFSGKRLALAFWRGKWALAAPVIILSGIYTGVTTPTEASDIAVIYSLFVGLVIKRTLTKKGILEAITSTTMTVGVMLAMVGFAVGFGRLITLYQFPQQAGEFILSISDNPQIILLMVVGFLLFAGTWMETISMIIILTPVLLPVIKVMGVDPILFGILLVLGCEMGFLTPPMGGNLFVAAKLADVSLERISIYALPFVGILLFWAVMLIFFPDIALWLPKMGAG